MTSGLEEKLKGLTCEVRFDEMLALFTTFQVGGPADALALPKVESELEELLERCRREDIPITLIGGGANTLVRDGGVRGVVISLVQGFRDITMLEEDEHTALIDAGAGVKIPALVRYAAERGWEGTECLAGVPGTIGGALAMNAGTAERYIEQAVESVRWIRLSGGRVETLPSENIRFEYRQAHLPEPGVVASVQFRVSRTDPKNLRALLQKDAAARRERQPWGLPCAGSIFRNPPGERAGRLIEAVGLKGHQVGGAQVSEVHGNFFVNRGGATAADLLRLIEEVRAKVNKQKGVALVLELNVIGEDTA
jgi:UDP-N-acetylmuramate dehydrogenase